MLTRDSASPDRTSLDVQGLSVEERRLLLAWIDDARGSGIDATEDLRLRPWPVPVTAVLIGVFRSGETMASWFLVGQNGLWTVVAVAEGKVVATRPSLREALEIIHRPGAEFDRRHAIGGTSVLADRQQGR
jgi:hypothetical protein